MCFLIKDYMRYFYTDELLPATCTVGDSINIPSSLVHRLYTVLRMRGGEAVTLFDAAGHTAQVKLGPKGTQNATCIAANIKPVPLPAFTLLIGLPKRDAYERVLRQATELNIAHIQSVITAFSAPDRLKKERALRIMTEAAEQCERLSLPTLHAPITFEEALATYNDIWWCYERTESSHSESPSKPNPHSALFVGPEGGFAPEEVVQLKSSSTPIIDLGTTILRVDTAVVAGLTVMKEALA